MRRACRLTPEARLDLLSIWEFIARENPRAADKVQDRIEAAFRSLARFPRQGHRRPDVHTTRPVLFWPVAPYIIVYLPDMRPIVIVRVLHAARDLDALL